MGNTTRMDVLSSSTWKETIGGEIKAKKAWKAKYGHQFELEDSCAPSEAGSRPATGMSQASRPYTGASRNSRAPSQMSNASCGPEQRQKLLDLKAKWKNIRWMPSIGAACCAAIEEPTEYIYPTEHCSRLTAWM